MSTFYFGNMMKKTGNFSRLAKKKVSLSGFFDLPCKKPGKNAILTEVLPIGTGFIENVNHFLFECVCHVYGN